MGTVIGNQVQDFGGKPRSGNRKLFFLSAVSFAAKPPFGNSPMKVKLNNHEFDRIVERAIHRIPAEIRGHLDNIVISVQDRPSKDLLEELGFPADEPLLGIFQGVPLPEKSFMEPSPFPDSILLFQQPLMEMCGTVEEIEEEIEITVAHEIAHYLGFSEEQLASLGYE